MNCEGLKEKNMEKERGGRWRSGRREIRRKEEGNYRRKDVKNWRNREEM